MFKTSLATAAALALTALTPLAAAAGGLAPEVSEAPVTAVGEDDVTGFAPALGIAPLAIGAGVVGLALLAAGGNGDDNASGTSGTN